VIDEVYVSDPTVWLPPRIDADTDRSYAALLDYARMGAGRSLRGLVGDYRKQSVDEQCTEKPPTTRFPTIARWSTEHDWQARVAEYDQRQAVADETAKALARERIAYEELRDYDAMVAEWHARWGKTAYNGNMPLSDFREMARLRADIADQGRRAVGLPDKVTESKHTGPGKDGAIVHELRPYADLDDEELERVLRG
jgi:hypothetical protein